MLQQQRHICLHGVHEDPERLIVGTQRRSRPYLVLVEASHISLSDGFMLLLLWPTSSISQVPGAAKHSSTQTMSGVRMPEKVRTDIFVQFPPPLPSALLYRSKTIFSTASLEMTRSSLFTFNPHYLKTTWHFKGSIQMKVSLDGKTFYNVTSHVQQNQLSPAASFSLGRFFCHESAF